MYMAHIAMVGMAVFAIPRGIFKVLAWLVMGLVGWLFTGDRSAHAQTPSAQLFDGWLVINGSSGADEILIQFNTGTVDVTIDHPTGQVVEQFNLNDVSQFDVFSWGGADNITVYLNPLANHSISGVTLSGGTGNDDIDGAEFNELIYGGDGDDCLMGTSGNDTIYGGNNDDSIHGGLGFDVLYGEAGDDALYHDQPSTANNPDGGTDFLDGGAGNSDSLAYNTVDDNDTGQNGEA